MTPYPSRGARKFAVCLGGPADRQSVELGKHDTYYRPHTFTVGNRDYTVLVRATYEPKRPDVVTEFVLQTLLDAYAI